MQIELISSETLSRPYILVIRVENGYQIRDLFVALINGQPWRVARTGIRVIGVNLTQILVKGSENLFELAGFSSYRGSSYPGKND